MNGHTERAGREAENGAGIGLAARAPFEASDLSLTFARYVADKAWYIAAFLLALALSETALVLALATQGLKLDAASIVYAFMLALFFLLVWLLADYVRQRSYFRELGEALRAGKLEAALQIRSGVTRDQRAVQRLIARQHEAYMDELGRYRRQQEVHQHFTHQWVHQMKTPVSVIDLLGQQGAEEPDAGDVFASIREEADRLTQGLDLMLYTARLSKFELDMHVRGVRLEALAREVVNRHKRLCIKHGIYPQIEGSASAETDEKWMSFAIGQLVTNAIKYSAPKPGAKRLYIRIAQEPDGGASIGVRDEGIGIPAHELARVFDPFFTGENGRIVGESTGMGLYLAKLVCRQLGHAITAESEQGSGTTVTIAFRSRTLHRIEER
ncbi:sensor histidine kinase [Paenibacillus methanolicus]|uniref:histidine kinase n=1 Tax=Paenibacillus methanolicus TaxID=582686 RepID=A0A5S5BVV8_9BACL|nr:sensor histidine kinase [Paenibacillus methanolicus]TYP71321.1 signal transduction histidine kinase [Paenibacillus methanolicus]